MKNLQKFFSTAGLMIAAACLILASCTKEGPQGATGPAGKDGTDGKDASETCKQCHAKAVVDAIATEFELSKHSWGEAAFEEAGNPSCGPCHEQKAFVYVCTNNTPSEFTFNATTGKWVNSYSSNDANAIGEISCFTCHTSLHTTYGMADLALTTVAPVSMTMWGGAKTINLTQGDGQSNLCVKCHQPRPLTCGNDPAGRLLNYDSVLNKPAAMMWDSTTGAKNTMLKPSYRMHVHYGAVGAVYAGMGGIEYPGTVSYTNSPHTTLATCQDCHMAQPMFGIAGGHAFNMRNAKESALGSSTTWNFAGCNVEGCHLASPLDAKSAKWTTTRTEIQGLLNTLATKINACGGGNDILHADATSANLWAGVTAGNYDGYLNIYDPSSNTGGYWRNPYPAGSWSADQKALNLSKPKFPSLTMLQTGALINFQFCLREYSLGIHNTQYVRALLTNTADMMATSL
jgi:hypothetical protein